jgi:hypothetical protein
MTGKSHSFGRLELRGMRPVDFGGSFKQKSGPLWRDRSRTLWGRVTADWGLVTAAGSSRAS